MRERCKNDGKKSRTNEGVYGIRYQEALRLVHILHHTPSTQPYAVLNHSTTADLYSSSKSRSYASSSPADPHSRSPPSSSIPQIHESPQRSACISSSCPSFSAELISLSEISVSRNSLSRRTLAINELLQVN